MATKATQPEPEQNEADVLIPEGANRSVTIGKDDLEMTFEQKPLSFFQKLELFSLLGAALDKAMRGPDGLTMSEIFDGPSNLSENLSDSNYRDADTFIKALAKLAQYAPELIADLYVIVLGVPKGLRDVVKNVMELPEDQGGLSDDDGFGILETFIDQNWEVMVDFFKERILPLVGKISNKLQESPQ